MNNLQIRFVEFATSIYKTMKPLMKNSLLESSVKQIVRSSTSVGANYSEAQSASSYRDFHNKIRIALKELQETHYWIHFLKNINPQILELNHIEKETEELLRILSTISKKTDPKNRAKK